jgi:hypothetical protein
MFLWTLYQALRDVDDCQPYAPAALSGNPFR